MAILTICRELPAHVSDAVNMQINPEIAVEKFRNTPKQFDYCISSLFLVVTFLTLLFSGIARFTDFTALDSYGFYIGDRDLYVNGTLEIKGTLRPRFERFVAFEQYNLGVRQFESVMLPATDYSVENLDKSPCVFIRDLKDDFSVEDSAAEINSIETDLEDCLEAGRPYYFTVGRPDRVDIDYGNGFFALKNAEIHINKFQLGYGFISTEFSNVNTALFSSSVWIAWIILFALTYATYGKLAFWLCKVPLTSFSFFAWQFSHQLFLFGVVIVISIIAYDWLEASALVNLFLVCALAVLAINTYRQNKMFFGASTRSIYGATTLHGISMLFFPFIIMAPLSILVILFYDFVGFLV